MSKFGYSEIINIDEHGRATAIKESFTFGVPNSKVVKQAESIRVENDKDAISEFLSALQKLKTKEQRYLCFEVFTSETDRDIHRVNICHMRDQDIAIP